MKSDQTSSQPERPPAPAKTPVRKSVLILAALVGIGALALVVIALNHGGPAGPSAGSSPEDGQAQASSGDGGAPDRVSPDSTGVRPRRAPPAADTPSEPEENPVQLVKTLSEVNLQPGELTPEKADKWKQNLERLIEQGIATLPVLREFFQKNDDIRFDSRAAGLLGEPTLRIAFLKVLSDIPSPDNVDLEEQILRSTTDPDEIVLLDRQLEMQEPGKYRELVIEAAKLALQKAKDGGLTGRDTTPLVKLLEKYGVTAAK